MASAIAETGPTVPVAEVCAGEILATAAPASVIQFCVAHAASAQVAAHVGAHEWPAVLKSEMAATHVEAGTHTTAVESAAAARVCIAPRE